MKQLLTLLATFLALHTAAQKIHFSDTSNRWKVVGWLPEGPVSLNWITATDDTFARSWTYGPLVFREDTTANKVYFRAPGRFGPDTAEYLLYNFNLVIGDTFKTRYVWHKVDSMDTVTINSVVHKVWYMSRCWDSASYFIGDGVSGYTVVEGIGCLLGPTYPAYPAYFEYIEGLVCFENRGVKPMLSKTIDRFDNSNLSCTSTYGLGVGAVAVLGSGPQIAPNPVTNETTLTFSRPFTGRIIIVSLTGIAIYSQDVNAIDRLPLGNILATAGIYLYQLVDYSDGSQRAGRLVRW